MKSTASYANRNNRPLASLRVRRTLNDARGLIVRQVVHEKLKRLGQTHLLEQWDSLTHQQQNLFCQQVEELDEDLFNRQRALHEGPQFAGECQQIEHLYLSDDAAAIKRGEELLHAGAVGCLILAGGEGSRLGISAPKGTFPIDPHSNKSLFQLLVEKGVAASRRAGSSLPLAIMTSPWTDRETRLFFEQGARFGLAEDQLAFFKQKTLPLLDDQGNLILSEGEIAKGADGNGAALALFLSSGLFQAWHERGVHYLIVIPVDNPLADPFDAELAGLCDLGHFDITARVVEKRNPEEKVGVFVQQGKRTVVVEYFELPLAESQARLSDGKLKHRLANINLFCFSMEFIVQHARKKLPLHRGYKALKSDPRRMAWKYETFLFDLVSYAERVAAVLSLRERCFAPLKGLEDVEAVQAALALKKNDLSNG